MLLCSAPVEALLANETAAASHEMSFETGLASDSNPFLSPSESYFDQNAGRMIEPVSISGFYTPVLLEGLLTTRRSFVSYLLEGDLYPESQTRNAESFELRVAPGLKLDFRGGRRDRALKIGPYASQNKKVYFDRDTGLAGQSGGVDVSDRYTYRGFGAEVALELEINRTVDLSIEGHAERRDYESVEGISSFDHDAMGASAGIGIRLGRPASLYLEHERRIRGYGERHARDLSGESSDANPLLDYAYASTEVGFRFRNAGRWRLGIGWKRTDRTDEFVGYNDYVQDRYKLRTSFGGRRWTLLLFGAHRDRRFRNAFIFDNPTSPLDGTPNPKKAYDTIEYGVELEVEWNHFRLVIGSERKDQETTDPRFTYERSRTLVGSRWVF